MPSEAMQRLQGLFAQLSQSQTMPLDDIYTTNVRFEDPFHAIEGRSELQHYFERLNLNVDTCTFTFHDVVETEDQGFVTWTMRLNVRRGLKKTIVLDGTTHVRYRDGLIADHKDYFDASKMVYEHVPVMGTVIRAIRRHM